MRVEAGEVVDVAACAAAGCGTGIGTGGILAVPECSLLAELFVEVNDGDDYF